MRGAGPAGSICSTLLARAGYRTLLIAGTAPSRWRPPEILAPATIRLLRQHGFLAAATDGFVRCRGVYGKWAAKPEFFDYELLACEAAVSIDRALFDSRLRKEALQSGVEIWSDVFVQRTHYDARQWTITGQRRGLPHVCEAPLLIEATGRSGPAAPIPQTRRAYSDRLLALACPLTLPRRDCQLMLLEADNEGWWYSTCDGNGGAAVVYLSDADLLPTGPAQRALFFRQRFETSWLMRKKLPELPQNLRLHTLDARTYYRHPCAGPASLAIGDAAYSVDPLSGAGIRRAIEMAVKSVSATKGFYAEKSSSKALQNYARWVLSEFVRWRKTKDSVYSTADPTLFAHEFWRRRVISRGAGMVSAANVDPTELPR